MVITSCDYETIPPPDCPSEGEILYQEDIKFIFETTCSYDGCHDGTSASPGNYTKLEHIRNDLKEIENRAIISRDMPPAGSMNFLTEEDRLKLNCWIMHGAPE